MVEAMAHLFGQGLSTAGLCLKVVSGAEGNPDLVTMALPICVASAPVKGVAAYGPIIVNQLLFHEVASNVSVSIGCRTVLLWYLSKSSEL